MNPMTSIRLIGRSGGKSRFFNPERRDQTKRYNRQPRGAPDAGNATVVVVVLVVVALVFLLGPMSKASLTGPTAF